MGLYKAHMKTNFVLYFIFFHFIICIALMPVSLQLKLNHAVPHIDVPDFVSKSYVFFLIFEDNFDIFASDEQDCFYIVKSAFSEHYSVIYAVENCGIEV